MLTEGVGTIFFLPKSRPKSQTDRNTKTIRKTTDEEILNRVERLEISWFCEEDPLPTKVRNRATQVRNAAKPLNRLEKGETIMAAIAPIQTTTVRLYRGSNRGMAVPVAG